MARVWHNGIAVLRVARDDAQEAEMGAPPGSAGSIAIDETVNVTLVNDIAIDSTRYTVVAGALRLDGNVVTVQPEAALTTQGRGRFVGGVRVSADRSTSGVTFADVPDLQFQLEPNSHYAFNFDGAYTAAAATTGIQLAVNGPASPDFLGLGFEVATSVSAWAMSFSAAYDSGVNGTASGGTTPLPFHVYGTVSTGAAGGLLKLRGRSEVNGSAVTIKRGSYGLLFKVG